MQKRIEGTSSRGDSGAIQAIASARDRDRAFREARRHTWLVRSLKLFLPLFALVSLGLFVGHFAFTSYLRPRGVEVGPVRIDTKHLTMETPHYEGFGKDGSRYKVRAREAITDLKRSGPIRLNEIDGTLTQTTGVVTNVKAAWGTYDEKKDVLELYERIDIDGSTGMKARLTRATVFNKQSRIVSDEPIWAENETGTITARSMVLDQKEHKAAFRQAVHVTMRPAQPAPKLAETLTDDRPAKVREAREGRPRAPTPLPGLAGNSGQPIEVRSETLDVDDNLKTALFRREVIARQGDATLEAPELDVLYEGRTALSDGAAKAAPAAGGAAAADTTKLKFIRARGGVVTRNKDDTAVSATLDYDALSERAVLSGDVVLTSTGDRRATAATAEFDQRTERATLKGSVVLVAGAERRVTGDEAQFDQKADTALVTGTEVVATQGRNVLRGRRLFVDRKAGTTRLESPPAPGVAAGRIATLFYQNQPDQRAGGKSRQQARTEGADGNPLAISFKTNPDAPIEVEADILDVFDQKRQAVFKGKVIAKQGDFTVTTVEMTAHYTGSAGLESVAVPGAAAPRPKARSGEAGGEGAAQLTRIEARQKVVVTSTDGRTVIGDWADFETKANLITVGGKVTVTDGRSSVDGPPGSRLLIDMTTGRSTFEQGTVAAPAPGGKAQPAVSGSDPVTSAIAGAAAAVKGACPDGTVCKKERFRVILYPKQVEETAKKKAAELDKDGWIADAAKEAEKRKKPRRKPAEASSWDATTSQPAGTRQ